MGLFDDVEDIDSAEVFTGVPAGTWHGIVYDVAMQNSSNGDPYIVFEYQFDVNGSEMKMSEWLRKPEGKRSDWDYVTEVNAKGHTQGQFNEWALAKLKTRLSSLGVPAERFNQVEPENLVGLDITATVVKDKDDYSKIKRLSLKKENVTTRSLPTARPAEQVVSAPAANVPNPFARA